MPHVIGTAGHVDHGKSTLVMALTGIDPDRLAEEKAREMTIDLGFAWLTLPNGENVGVVDVPGHRDFIENMLAGVGGIDLAVFVIAADEGIMPQTREHLAIIDLLEIPAGVVALTKIDLVTDPDWLELVSADIREALQGTTLQDAPLVPVSARTGEGLDRLIDAIQNALSQQSPRPDRGRPRLPVDRVFTMSGFGTVVTGTLSEGSFAVGDEIEILPAGRRARVRGVQNHKTSVEIAHPGSRIAINLSGIDRDHVQRGDVIALPGLLTGTTLIDVRFRHLADMNRPLRHNAQVKFFSGAAETVAQARLLGDQELAPGAEGWLQLRLETPVALDKGARFILRYPSPAETLGGGTILDPHPAHRWRRFKPDVLDRLETLLVGSPEDLMLHALEGQATTTIADVVAQSDLPINEAARILDNLRSRGDVIALPDGWIIARASWARLAERLNSELRAFHQANPLRAGMPREALRSRLGLEQKSFQKITAFAAESGLVSDEKAIIRLPEHTIRFNPTQEMAIRELRKKLDADSINTPSVSAATDLLGAEALQALIESGEIVQASPEVLFATESYEAMVAQIRAHIRSSGSITVAQARDLFSTSRKYALALLEHLDEVGITVRRGDERVLR